MPSQEANNVIGALGGVVLAACLVPQLWRLYRTRSAHDLSYLWLVMYNIGLLLTFVYLYYEDALIGWICMLVEIGFACVLIAGKAYLDHFGPHGRSRAAATTTQHAKAGSSGKLDAGPSEIKVHVVGPLPGTPAAPPGLHTAPQHAAQQLLLDVQLALPPQPPLVTAAVAATSTDSDLEAGGNGSGSGCGASIRSRSKGSTGAKSAGGSMDAGTAGDAGTGTVKVAGATCEAQAFRGVADMLEAALRAAGLRVVRRQLAAVHNPPGSFQGSSNSSALPHGSAVDEEATEPGFAFFTCSDGFATVTYHSSSGTHHSGTATLSVDFMAASEAAAQRTAAAAQLLCEQLQAAYPGTQVTATTVARMLRH